MPGAFSRTVNRARSTSSGRTEAGTWKRSRMVVPTGLHLGQVGAAVRGDRRQSTNRRDVDGRVRRCPLKLERDGHGAEPVLRAWEGAPA